MVAAVAFDPFLQITGDQYRESAARDSLLSFTRRMFPAYIPAAHHRKIAATLERVERGEIDRLIITMPPRHGKSELASKHFPAWYLGRHPRHRVIACSYTANLAYRFSRQARNIVASDRWPFDVKLADDLAAVQEWDLTTGGGYIAAGVGGSITGSGADLLIIDDPVKSADDADSEIKRDHAWQWYQDTAYPRLQSDGAVVVIGCMTGDTAVLRPDGATTPIRAIKAGDVIATYENGALTTSRVLNWINHGPDSVYEIRTKSGIITRANERHPFLVDRGDKREWIRLKNLKAGDILVRVRSQKERGRASNARSMDATSPLSARDTATLITTKLDGRPEPALHQSTMSPGEPRISSTATASPLLSTMPCSMRRVADAPSVESNLFCPPIRTCQTEETNGSLLTIATTPARFVDSSATNATSLSGTATRKNSSSKPLPTSDFTPDEIVSITPAGIEDVFDIEVERTENFIADGVVSHNTRWHDDDLIGRLLSAQDEGADTWDVLHLPAISEAGEALWPEVYPIDKLLRRKANMSSRMWEAQFQGQPVPLEGGMFPRSWWQRYTTLPPMRRVELCLDSAFKEGVENDYSALALWGDDGAGSVYLIRAWRARVAFPDLIRLGHDAHAWARSQFPNLSIPFVIEDKASGQSAIQVFRQPYHTASGTLPRLPVVAFKIDGHQSKTARAEGVTGIVEGKSAYIPNHAPWLDDWIVEHERFPFGEHDDQVDTTAMALTRLALRKAKKVEIW
jgi:predicted phage terminase large subunit-like protein